jgi:hypothetical protein
MIPRIRRLSELYFAVCGGLALSAVLVAGFPLYEICTFTDAPTGQAIQINGTLSIGPKKTLKIHSKGVETLSCSVGWCGYPLMYRDIGQDVTVWYSDGRIIQVRVGEVVTDTRQLTLEAKRGSVQIGAVLLLLCPVFGFLGWRQGKLLKPDLELLS